MTASNEIELAPGLTAEVERYGPTRRMQVLVAVWLESLRSPHTRRAYARSMKMWQSFCDEAGIDPLSAIRAHGDIWHNKDAGYPSKPAQASLAQRLSAIASFYDYLVREQVIDHSPFEHVTRPNVSNESVTRGLTTEEAAAMFKCAADTSPRESALISLLMFLGLRCDEVVMADVTALGYDDGHRTIDVMRKNSKWQRLALSPVVVEVVEAYLNGRDSGPMVLARTGERISVRQVFRIVQGIAQRAGVRDPENVSPHSLRHTYATMALDAGVPLRQVQMDMGHVDPKTTIRYDRARRRLKDAGTYKVTEWILGKPADSGEETA